MDEEAIALLGYASTSAEGEGHGSDSAHKDSKNVPPKSTLRGDVWKIILGVQALDANM